ncbi:MAG: hypothetical protein WBE86_10055 [Candidatus Acidiferrales bacterium]
MRSKSVIHLHRRAALSLIFVISIAISLVGCRRHNTSFASPEEAAKLIENCIGNECAQLSSALRLSFTLRAGSIAVSTFRGKFEPDFDDALLQVVCSQDFELVLLTRESSGRWRYTDSLPFPWGAHDVVRIGLERAIDRADDAIIIHNDVVGFGTGIYQADFLIIRVLKRKLHVVLDTIEKGSVYPPQSERPNQWVEQHSSFEIAPATEKDPGNVTETMTLNIVGKRAVVERQFDWKKDFGLFEPGFWTRSMQPAAEK